MGNLGKSLDSFGSKLFNDPLKVVQLGFKGYDLGLTTEATTLKPDLDIKGIMYQQRGTKADDHVVTGADWLLTATFGEIKTSLLTVIAPYLVASSGSVGNDSGHIKSDLYESMKDTVAGTLRVAAVQDQVPSEEIQDLLNFYIAIPIINADLINWGADVQRNLPVEFRIKNRVFTPAESATVKSAHGYWGDPTAEDLPAADWPDRS